MFTNTPSTEFEVVIVGGGWVGMNFALMLPAAWRIAIIESLPANQTAVPLDNRTLALSASSQRILAAQKLWPQLQTAATPITQVHVSSSGRFAACRLQAKEFGLAALGYTIPADQLTLALQAAIQLRSNIVWYSSAKVSHFVVKKTETHLQIKIKEQEQHLRAALVVAADGMHSKLREMLHIPIKTHDYRQTAIIANVELAKPHNNQAFERFLPAGPLAMLPRHSKTAAMVWCLPPAQAEPLLQSSDKEFLHALQSAVGYRLGRLLKISARSTFAVHAVQAQQLVKPGFVLLGSAACHLHPIAAQSLNLALRDAAVLAELLVAEQQEKHAIGDLQVLKHYENLRHSEQNRVAAVAHGAVHLFSSALLPMQLIGGLSLLAVDNLPIAKRQLVQQAIGLGGYQSKLMSGVSL